MMGCPPQGSSQHVAHTEADPRSAAAQAQPLTSSSSGSHPVGGHLYRSHPGHELLASPSRSHYPQSPESLLPHQHSLLPAETHFPPKSRVSQQQQQHHFSSGQFQQQQQQHPRQAAECLSQQQAHHHLQVAQGQLPEDYHHHHHHQQSLAQETVTSQYQQFAPEKSTLQPHHYSRSAGTGTLHAQQQQQQPYHLSSHSQMLQARPAQPQTFLPQSSQAPPVLSPGVHAHASGAQTHSPGFQAHAPGFQALASGVQVQIPSIHKVQGQEGGAEIQGQQASETSIVFHQYRVPPAEHSPSDMLDKKPTLQVMTAEHSPGSPGSATSSPRFIFPDMQRSSSSGHLASDSGSSPFMSPVKREVKWEVGTPPQSSELDLPMQYSLQQAYRERARILSGDTELSETLVDSETGSSILEDSSSSREQSPFSAMAESLSLRSPSEHSPSPLARKVFQRQAVALASEDEELQGDELERGGGGGAGFPGASGDGDTLPPPKLFKKRLHERYVLSLQDCPRPRDKVKEEVGERYTMASGDIVEGEGVYLDPRRPLTKTERPDSPQNSESSLPKSPRRSSSDTDNMRSEVQEMGASSADEGDVFMEPKRVRTKTRPPSLHHQREPLDLSRGTFYSPGFRSSPPVDPAHLSPAAAATPKHFSPPSVFRSPHHRLPPHHQYSPHQGLLSPQQQQSQSPLCPVPEGGRIFNFNVPSPLEGAHSDSDLISPSPMSPRIFTFPPQGMMNPMAEVNRLAVSPRAPYTPPPPFLQSKVLGSPGSGLEKFGEQHGFYGKRSLSESDMTYLCPVCGQVFPTNDNLAKHMAKHLPTETIRSADNNKVHYCKVCNRSFSRSDMLTRHMRLHTGLKPYECGDCGQVFSRSDHLNTHRRTHTGEKPYRCPQCPYAACRRDMITRHMRTHVKRTSRRGRYLSVPDEGDGQKSGSISSTETTDSVGGHTCSVSSVDSVECESPLPSSSSTRHSYIGASVDSLLSPEPEEMMSPPPGRHHHHHHHHRHHHTVSPSHRPSEDLEEGEEGKEKLEGSSRYDRFMHYRKPRNWSTTSLESVDSEIREVFVDDPFLETELAGGGDRVKREGGGGGGTEGRGMQSVSTVSPTSKDAVGVEAPSLQKCFISRGSTGSSGGSS